MRKLYPSEKIILQRLIFPEPYDVLLEETGLDTGSLRDDLINLVNYRLVEVFETDSADPENASFFDSDNLHEFTFRATKTGLKQIRQTV